MLYLFELIANASFDSRNPMLVPRRSVERRQRCRVFARTKWRHQKWTDQELLDKQMRRLTPPRNDGVIAVLLVAMFLVGMTLGVVL
jgi:hypothetical protein